MGIIQNAAYDIRRSIPPAPRLSEGPSFPTRTCPAFKISRVGFPLAPTKGTIDTLGEDNKKGAPGNCSKVMELSSKGGGQAGLLPVLPPASKDSFFSPNQVFVNTLAAEEAAFNDYCISPLFL